MPCVGTLTGEQWEEEHDYCYITCSLSRNVTVQLSITHILITQINTVDPDSGFSGSFFFLSTRVTLLQGDAPRGPENILGHSAPSGAALKVERAEEFNR